MKDLEETNTNLVAQVEQFHGALKEVHEENQGLKAKEVNWEKERQDFMKRIGELEEVVGQSNGEDVHRLKDDVQRLERENKRLSKQVDNLQAEVKGWQQKYDNKVNSQKELEARQLADLNTINSLRSKEYRLETIEKDFGTAFGRCVGRPEGSG